MSFAFVSSTLYTQAPPYWLLSLLLNFEQYMPFYTSELRKGSTVAGVWMWQNVFIPPLKNKLPVFDTLESVQPESAWGKDATPALHLSAFICLQLCL